MTGSTVSRNYQLGKALYSARLASPCLQTLHTPIWEPTEKNGAYSYAIGGYICRKKEDSYLYLLTTVVLDQRSLIIDNTVLITDVKLYYHQHTLIKTRYFSIQWKRRRSSPREIVLVDANGQRLALHRVAIDNVGWQRYHTTTSKRLIATTSKEEVTTRALLSRGNTSDR